MKIRVFYFDSWYLHRVIGSNKRSDARFLKLLLRRHV